MAEHTQEDKSRRDAAQTPSAMPVWDDGLWEELGAWHEERHRNDPVPLVSDTPAEDTLAPADEPAAEPAAPAEESAPAELPFPSAPLTPAQNEVREQETKQKRRKRQLSWMAGTLAAVALILVAAVFLVYGGGWQLIQSVWARSTPTTAPMTTPTTAPTEPPAREIATVPSPVRAVRVTPAEDLWEEAATTEQIQEHISALLDTLTAWNFNTVVLPVTAEDGLYFVAEGRPLVPVLSEKTDVLAAMIAAAQARGVAVIAQANVAQLDEATAAALAEYDAEAFLLDGAYSEAVVTALQNGGERERAVGAVCDTAGTALPEGNIGFAVLRGNADEETLRAWDARCTAAQIPLYLLHPTEYTDDDAWAAQWKSGQRLKAWRGGVFPSLTVLTEHPEAREALQAVMKAENGDSEVKGLTFTSPTTTTVRTDESVISFRGSADPDFPLWLGNEQVKLSSRGLFSIDCKLTAGDNTFTFSHKGYTVTYTVTYQVDVLRSVAPQEDLALSGGAKIAFSAIAYKSARVSARIGDTDIPMRLTPIATEDGVEEDSDYQNFSGEYTLPASREEAYSLGYITVFASFAGKMEALEGGSVTVKAKPKPKPTTRPATTTKAGETARTTVPTIPPDPSRAVLAEGTILQICEPYAAETFNGDAAEDYSRPTNAYLPEGTKDVLVSEVYDSASGNYYYLLGCGRRVYQDEAECIEENGKLTANRLTVDGVTVQGGYTTLKLGSLWHVPYNLQLLPQYYPYANNDYPSYDITAMTAEYVEITFSYTTEVSGTPDLSQSPLFTTATWKKGSGNTYVLRLNLAKKGQFYGYSAKWNEAGELQLEFRHPTYVGGNSAAMPLAGMTLIVDAGHGGMDAGTDTLVAGLYEKELNLRYALTLQEQLESLGATVVMVRTQDVQIRGRQIGALTRETRPDLFISLHMDAAGAAANGPSVHYYNEYSYAPSQAVFDRIYAAYTAEKSTTKRGARWDPFYVTRTNDVPSMLIECGFVTNVDDFELLTDETFQQTFCAAVAQGVIDYAKTLPNL